MATMNFCTKCGKKIENKNNKFCTNCGNRLFSFTLTIQGVEQDNEPVESEKEAANTIIDDLGIDKSLFEYAKPSLDYSTIRYKGIDLFRIKYTDNTKWIRIPMTTPMRKRNMNNPLFDAEPNKNKVFWKSDINNLLDYKEYLIEMINIRDEKKD